MGVGGDPGDFRSGPFCRRYSSCPYKGRTQDEGLAPCSGVEGEAPHMKRMRMKMVALPSSLRSCLASGEGDVDGAWRMGEVGWADRDPSGLLPRAWGTAACGASLVDGGGGRG